METLKATDWDSQSYYASGSFNAKTKASCILFASMHEGVEAELFALQQHSHGLDERPEVFCIASGGCNAFALLLASPARVHALDINPAQVHLCELKVAAWNHLNEGQLSYAFTHDARGVFRTLKNQLSSEAQNFWSQNFNSLRYGLNGCGAVDRIIKACSRFIGLWLGRSGVRAIFATDDEKRREVFERRICPYRWKLMFAAAFNPLVLRLLYAGGFVNAIPPHFARRLRERFEAQILAPQAQQNPYLWFGLRGRYPGNRHYWPLAYRPENLAIIRDRLPNLQLEVAEAAQWLENTPPHSIDFFALSNILDAASPEFEQQLLKAIAHAARPGAVVVFRSILSRLPQPKTPFVLDEVLTEQTKSRDRAPICCIEAVWRVR